MVTTREHIHHVVIEYGIVNLYGKESKQRAKALSSIVHPDNKAMLEEVAHKIYKSFNPHPS